MGKKPKHAFRAWFWAFLILFIAFGGLAVLVIFQKDRLSSLESSIALIKEERIPLRFRIAARSGGGLEVKLKFYDADGKEIAQAERSLKGESLFLDFLTVPVAGSYLSFPKTMFTEAIPAVEGVALMPFYDSGGFPRIYASKGMDRKTRDGLSALFIKLKLGGLPGGSFGNAVHDVKEFKAFDIGTVYRVVTRRKGGIEIMEEAE